MGGKQDDRWVVFDLGETLVDESRNWANWATYIGVPKLTFFAVFGAVIASGRPHTDAFAYFRPNFSLPAEVPRKAQAGLPWSFDADDLYADALPTLAVLREAGLRLAVMANQPAEAMPFLDTLPVDAVAVSAEWGIEKPDPLFFGRVCEVLDAPPERIAYVGDRVDNDVVPAHALGMTAVHVVRGPWGHLQKHWPQAADADLRCDSLTDLPDGLRRVGFLGDR